MRSTVRMTTLVALILAGAMKPAEATTIDFDDLVGPVALTTQYVGLGVTFSATEDGGAVGALAGVSLTGTYESPRNVWSNCVGTICGGRADILRMDFTSPVSNLQWWTDTAGGLAPIFRAYDSGGTLLEEVVATTTPEGTYALSAFSVSGIAFVELLQPNDDWGYYIDTLSFDAAPVPEPGTFMLLGAGLVAFTVRRRFMKRRI